MPRLNCPIKGYSGRAVPIKLPVSVLDKIKMRGPKSCQDKSVPSRSQGCHFRVADATRAKAATFGWQMRAGSDEMKMQPRFPDQDRTGEAKRRVGWPIRTITSK